MGWRVIYEFPAPDEPIRQGDIFWGYQESRCPSETFCLSKTTVSVS